MCPISGESLYTTHYNTNDSQLLLKIRFSKALNKNKNDIPVEVFLIDEHVNTDLANHTSDTKAGVGFIIIHCLDNLSFIQYIVTYQ